MFGLTICRKSTLESATKTIIDLKASNQSLKETYATVSRMNQYNEKKLEVKNIEVSELKTKLEKIHIDRDPKTGRMVSLQH